MHISFSFPPLLFFTFLLWIFASAKKSYLDPPIILCLQELNEIFLSPFFTFSLLFPSLLTPFLHVFKVTEMHLGKS